MSQSRLTVSPGEGGGRLDKWLANRLPELSRSRIQALIRGGLVFVGGRAAKANHAVRAGDVVDLEVPAPVAVELRPEPIPLDVLYEDSDIIVVNKPAGLVVHPAPGHPGGTLVNALLNHCRDLAGIGGELRPGIVHRLDKDTSGALVAAKNEVAMRRLVSLFKGRHVTKVYVAIVAGVPSPPAGLLETLVGRSRHDRQKMTVNPSSGGREAVTRYETVESYEGASLLRVRIETGRSHQIRVHMSHIGNSILGDAKYGRARRIPGTDQPVERQMLHAASLSFRHPRSGRAMEFQAPLPADMEAVLAALRAARRGQH